MQLASQLSILMNYMKTKRGILHNTDGKVIQMSAKCCEEETSPH